MTLYLELRAEKDEAEKQHKKHPDSVPRDPFDCKLMKAWAGGAVHDARFCWDNESLQPVSLWREEDGRPGPPILIYKRNLYQFIDPSKEVLPKLLGDRANSVLPQITVNGKPLCPDPLVYSGMGLVRALQWAADMKEWGTPPFDGPTGSWPAATLEVLRHVRAMMNLVEMNKMDKQVESQEG